MRERVLFFLLRFGAAKNKTKQNAVVRCCVRALGPNVILAKKNEEGMGLELSIDEDWDDEEDDESEDREWEGEIEVPHLLDEYIPSLAFQEAEVMREASAPLRQRAFQALANHTRRKDPRQRLLYPGEYHEWGQNFTGPGTRVDKEWVRKFPPYDAIDRWSRRHDIRYSQIERMTDLTDEERRVLLAESDALTLRGYEQHSDLPSYYSAHTMLRGKGVLERSAPRRLTRALLGSYSAI